MFNISRSGVLRWMGIWLVLLSILGIPRSWENILLVFSGLVAVAFSYGGSRKKPIELDKKSPENLGLNDEVYAMKGDSRHLTK